MPVTVPRAACVPGPDSVILFLVLARHGAGRGHQAVAKLITLAPGRIQGSDLARYQRALPIRLKPGAGRRTMTGCHTEKRCGWPGRNAAEESGPILGYAIYWPLPGLRLSLPGRLVTAMITTAATAASGIRIILILCCTNPPGECAN